MRATRIELAYQAWEACILPLNYAREGVDFQALYTALRAIVKKNCYPAAWFFATIVLRKAFGRPAGKRPIKTMVSV